MTTPDQKPHPLSPPVDGVIAYRVNDAATVSGLSRATLYRLIKEGKLRSRIVAGRRLITPAALRELFSEAA
jgi:excisionase family DNA binding protein